MPSSSRTSDGRAMKPSDIARRLGVNVHRVHGWIDAGESRAINTAANLAGKPRWKVLPEDLARFEAARGRRASVAASRQAATARKSRRDTGSITEEGIMHMEMTFLSPAINPGSDLLADDLPEPAPLMPATRRRRIEFDAHVISLHGVNIHTIGHLRDTPEEIAAILKSGRAAGGQGDTPRLPEISSAGGRHRDSDSTGRRRTDCHRADPCALNSSVKPDQVVELRAIKVNTGYGKPHIEAGWFDYDHLPMMANSQAISGKAAGVYFTLNPINPHLLARWANKVKRAEDGELTKDKDITSRCRLLIDVDPVRDPYISATDAEKAESLESSSRFVLG